MNKHGQIRFHSDGSVTTMKGKQVARARRFGGRKYTLVSAVGGRKKAESSAKGWREQYGAARVIKLEPGNYGVYATI